MYYIYICIIYIYVLYKYNTYIYIYIYNTHIYYLATLSFKLLRNLQAIQMLSFKPQV